MSVCTIFNEYKTKLKKNYTYLISVEIYTFNCSVKTNCMIDLILSWQCRAIFWCSRF